MKILALAACLSLACVAGDAQAATGHVYTRESPPTATPWLQYQPADYDWRSAGTHVQVNNSADKTIVVSVYAYKQATQSSVLVSHDNYLGIGVTQSFTSPSGAGVVAVYVWCPLGEGWPAIDGYGDGSCI
jgi:hypothetical protein